VVSASEGQVARRVQNRAAHFLSARERFVRLSGRWRTRTAISGATFGMRRVKRSRQFPPRLGGLAGYYRIQNVNSGLYVNVVGASTNMGSQYPTVTTYNDQWRPVLHSDGSYSFYNALSAQALDVPAASTAGGVQLDQWGENASVAQEFSLINVTPSFTIASSPASLTVMQGSSITSTIAVTDQNGFTSAVTLAASGLPSGVTSAFALNPTTSIRDPRAPNRCWLSPLVRSRSRWRTKSTT
jgi:hypothetical protein